MANKYKLSVAVIVYNTEPYLRDCFDSLVNQTLKELEIIIVNDESPDNSALIIEEYQRNYPNIKVINQRNSGGAVAGNTGLQAATGEYVTVMDSDDVLPLDAYEKLYQKAKETDAEIVIGKPYILVNEVLKEVQYKPERDVWKKPRTITNLLEYPDIFYDGFYWNKIYKREFLFKYDCFMPPGMLYADRPMVHKAFLYANRIEIIPDVVYYWRKRGDTEVKSITQLKSDIKNFKDRITSLNYQIDYVENFGNQKLLYEFLKRNIDRLFFPIMSIIEDEDFKAVYLSEVKGLLKRIPDVFNNDLGITKNIYIYLILNDMEEELINFLNEPLKGPIIEETGTYYWALPYFRNDEVDVPDEFFVVKVLQSQFIRIERIHTNGKWINIDGGSIPEAFAVDNVKLEFVSRMSVEDKKEFRLERDGNQSFSGRIELLDQSNTSIYDVFIVFNTGDREDKFRITKSMIGTPNETIEMSEGTIHRKLFFTKAGNLSFLVVNIQLQSVTIDDESIKINGLNAFEDFVAFHIKDRATNEKIYFHRRNQYEYELPWKHFLEVDKTYDFYISTQNNSIRMNTVTIDGFKEKEIELNRIYKQLYQTDKGNLSLKTISTLRKKISNFR
jgi:glycosyltransferase involved in cell wall biosynthesis